MDLIDGSIEELSDERVGRYDGFRSWKRHGLVTKESETDVESR